MKEDTFFTVIIPTYNRAKLIKKTIDSVLAQDYPNFEIIVVDDGSIDNTEEVIKEIGSPKIHYYWKKNEERSVARNFGIKKAQGDYVTFLDSDDVLYPNHLSEAKKLIEKENPPVFHINYSIQKLDGSILNRRNNYKHGINSALYSGNVLSCAGVFLSKPVALANPFNEDPRIISSEDWELWLRIGAVYEFKYSPVVTSCLIEHPDRSVHKITKDQLISSIDALIEGLQKDKNFMSKSRHKLNAIKAHMSLHMAYKLLFNDMPYKALVYLVEALRIDFISTIRQRLFYGVIKNWLLRRY
jgi:glycosyltransferase involved in cell wall biosynthesis